MLNNDIIFLEEVSSTNDYLKAHYSALSHGSAVCARRQTAGRGRRGHTWQNFSGVLMMSVLLKNLPEIRTVTPRVGLAACEAIEQAVGRTDPKIAIKWPNDLVCGGRKLCGILCESAVFGDETGVICGLGVNISQSEAEFHASGLEHAGSLAMFFDMKVEQKKLAELIRERIIFRTAEPFEACFDEYRRRVVNIGREVRIIENDIERVAFAEDVAPDGELICRDESGQFRVFSGEVSVRGIGGYL